MWRRSFSEGGSVITAGSLNAMPKSPLAHGAHWTRGAINMLHKDVASHVERWLDHLRIDPGNHYISALLNKLQLVHTKELKELSALGVGYAALFLTEGTGLLFRKWWGG